MLCFPLDCFHPCQPHGVVSEDYSWNASWKLPVVNVHSLATYSTQRQNRTGSCFFKSGYAVTYLLKNNPHTHIRQFFLSTKRMDSFGRNGSSGVRTQDRPVMSRLLWPTELSFLSSKKIQSRCDICLFTTVAVLDHQPQQRLKPPGTFDCSFSHRRCDRWLKGISLKKGKRKSNLHQEKDINSMQSCACGIRTHA